MPIGEEGQRPPVAVRVVLKRVDARWRNIGVPRGERLRLLADVESDLQEAYADGVTPEAALGVPADVFADEVATVSGVERRPPGLYGRMLIASGAAMGACFAAGMATMFPATFWLLDHVGSFSDGLPFVVYALFGLVAAFSVRATVGVALAGAPRVPETLRAVSVLLPASAALSLPLAVLLGYATDFSTRPGVVVSEILVVAGSAVAALLLARRWAMRGLGSPAGTSSTA